MTRIDWLGDMGTGFGGRCVGFWGIFCLMYEMARIDWGGWGSATHGKDMEKKRRREAFEEGWTGRGIGKREIGQK
jgi:hypothetical protein